MSIRSRQQTLDHITNLASPLDMVIIGGGATGASVALDAAARGFEVALLEQHDFGKGTSSRSTKLVHGGVRYLAQGNIALVRDALKERTRLRNNAPHVVQEMSFIVPCANRWERLWYGIGFKVYDLLSGRSGFRRSRITSQKACLTAVPTLRSERASGGVLYSDGQFDDSRLLINMIQTAVEQGALALNYARVEEIQKDQHGKAAGVTFSDIETGRTYQLAARCIINATGPFCDSVRKLDQTDSTPLVAASQGVHLVLPQRFLPGQTAVIVPKTSDGRVIFMIPWHRHVLIGTTDTPISAAVLEPQALPEEIEFLLSTAGEYLSPRPTREDVLSVFTGIRPLVGKGEAADGDRPSTSQLSRDHSIFSSESGMLTITGGKWTTARKMGEDCVNRAMQTSGLPDRPCRTENLKLHGANNSIAKQTGSSIYGSDFDEIERLAATTPELADKLCVAGNDNGAAGDEYSLRGAEVVWAVRHELARSVEDVLARRSRLLFLNARLAASIAPQVAQIMARELGMDAAWEANQITEFQKLAAQYQL